MIGWKELLIVLVIVLLVFGTKRLANLGKDLGEGVRGFKKGMHGDGEGDAGDPPRPPARLGEEPRDAAPGDTGDRSGSTRPPPPRDEA